MYRVTGLTDDNFQKATLIVGENETCDFKLYFCATQYSWYFDWKYKDITSKGNKVILSPNILRYFRNRLPFGLAFLSDDNIPPFKVDDFVSRVSLYILDSDDIEQLEDYVFNPKLLNQNPENREVI